MLPEKLTEIEKSRNREKTYELIRYEQVYNNANHKLQIQYIGAKELDRMPTMLNPYPKEAKTIELFSYLDDYSDTFSPTYNGNPVFGRMDPIVNYQNTTRKITLSLKIPAVDLYQARMNLAKLSKFASFMYPVYGKNINGGHYIKQPPLSRLKFGNLIKDQKSGKGLYGYFDGGLNIKWDLESGIFIGPTAQYREKLHERGDADGGGMHHDYLTENTEDGNRYYPKIVNLSLTFVVLHDHLLGHGTNEVNAGYVETMDEIKDVYGFHKHVPMHTGIESSGVELQSGNEPNQSNMTNDELVRFQNEDNNNEMYISSDNDRYYLTGQARTVSDDVTNAPDPFGWLQKNILKDFEEIHKKSRKE